MDISKSFENLYGFLLNIEFIISIPSNVSMHIGYLCVFPHNFWLTSKSTINGVREIAHLVKCWLYNLVDLSSSSSDYIKCLEY